MQISLLRNSYRARNKYFLGVKVSHSMTSETFMAVMEYTCAMCILNSQTLQILDNIQEWLISECFRGFPSVPHLHWVMWKLKISALNSIKFAYLDFGGVEKRCYQPVHNGAMSYLIFPALVCLLVFEHLDTNKHFEPVFVCCGFFLTIRKL